MIDIVIALCKELYLFCVINGFLDQNRFHIIVCSYGMFIYIDIKNNYYHNVEIKTSHGINLIMFQDCSSFNITYFLQCIQTKDTGRVKISLMKIHFLLQRLILVTLKVSQLS